MTAHRSFDEGSSHPTSRRRRRNELVRLGWSQLWLMTGILGGMLALMVAILFAHFLSL